MGLIAQLVYEINDELYDDIRNVLGADTWTFERMYDSYCSQGDEGLKKFFVIEEDIEFDLFNKIRKVLNNIKIQRLTADFNKVASDEKSS